jgi:hypothetical protein
VSTPRIFAWCGLYAVKTVTPATGTPRHRFFVKLAPSWKKTQGINVISFETEQSRSQEKIHALGVL